MIEENEDEFVEGVGIKGMHYNNIVDRYFTKFYIDENTDKEQFVFFHTNGVIMCGLGSNHYLIKMKNEFPIKKVTNLNKLTKISGKKKHGAYFLNENEPILQLTLEDNTNIEFQPKIKAKLLEINDNIFNDPSIIQKFPEKHGFLCFLLSDSKSIENLKEKFENKKLNK